LIFGPDFFQSVQGLESVMKITSGGVVVDDYKPSHSEYLECWPEFEWIEKVYKIDFSMSGDIFPSFEITFMVGNLNFWCN
jgi:hypothetical protein